jgi:hypothetical protein
VDLLAAPFPALDRLVATVGTAGARAYLPSDRPGGGPTAAPPWDQVEAGFRAACPDVEVVRLASDDALWVETTTCAMARLPGTPADTPSPTEESHA